MKFYRVHYSCEGGNSAGFSWHTSMKSAKKQATEAVENDPDEYKIGGFPEIDSVEIEPTKSGILSALKRYAEHPDNG